jgi:hypothetical protein
MEVQAGDARSRISIDITRFLLIRYLGIDILGPFDGAGGLEVVDVGFEQDGVLVVVFIGQCYGLGSESVFQGVHGGGFAAFLGDGSVRFRAVGTGGIDLALSGHQFSLSSTSMLGVDVEVERPGFWMLLKMGRL